MGSTLAPAAKRATTRLQRDELYELVESGHFGNARVELIAGELYTAFPEKRLHDDTVGLVYEALRAGRQSGTTVYRQNFVEFPLGDALQPDVVVISQERALGSDNLSGEEPLLVVEVATTTLRRDRSLKAELYATAGVAEYWIVNPRARQIEVRRDPSGPEYVSHQLCEGRDRVSPLFAPDLVLSVESLMPALDPR